MRCKLWTDRISNENGNLCAFANVVFCQWYAFADTFFLDLSEFESPRTPKIIL